MVVDNECEELLRACEQRARASQAMCEQTRTQYVQTMQAIHASRTILHECDRFLRRNRHLIVQERGGGRLGVAVRKDVRRGGGCRQSQCWQG